MDIIKAKEQVIRAGKELSQSGLIARTWGNVSCRTAEDEFAITASGRNYLTLTPDEVIQIKMEDLSYEGEIKPSSEKKLHKEIYRIKGEAGFVIHTHQNNASAVSAMGLDKIVFEKEYEGLGKSVICADYGLPGSKKLCKNTAAAVAASEGKAVIMRSHGAVCYGRDYEEAFKIAHNLEEACGDYLESIGVPSWKLGEEPAKAEGDNTYLWNSNPAIMKFMEVRNVLKPYLDDFAQLAGTKLKVIEEDEAVIEKAIAEGTPLLVRGKGALCAAAKQTDAEALSIVIEKNCRAALAAIGKKPINPVESFIMRQVYLNKYSKLSK